MDIALKADTELVTVQRNGNGAPLKTIDNFLAVMRQDRAYADVRFNLLKGSPELHHVDGGKLTIERWSDRHEAESRNYIEAKYGLYNDHKHADALRILFAEREYNPILDIVDNLEWDGEERCEHFLTRWGKAEDTKYTREVSRLIFAGGIWRLYMPGCKFDDVPVLVGTQGCGKSTLVRWLAINDDWHGEAKNMDESAGAIEQLEGKFICEIQELAAMTKAKQVESVKAFVTRQCDKYRRPYDRQTSELPRRCIFVGTSNNPQFLVDLTGNRRFYPVTVGLTRQSGYELYDHEAEVRDYILQCWAEAKQKYKEGRMPNYADRTLIGEYQAAQENAAQDDWRVGTIEDYLADFDVGEFVCTRQIKHEALSANRDFPTDPSPVESKDIGIIMAKMEGWERSENPHRTQKWGRQRGWVKVAKSRSELMEEAAERREIEQMELPF